MRNGPWVGQCGPAPAIKILRRLRFREAIEAAEIAPIGDAHPQVAQDAPVSIHEQAVAGHCLEGGLVTGGGLVSGAILVTVPSECTSTLRSALVATAGWAVASVVAGRDACCISRCAPFSSAIA